MSSTFPMAYRASGLALTLVALLALAPASAQDFSRVAPNQPAPQPPGTVTAPVAKPIVPPQTNQLLLPSLKGLRFVATVKEIVRTGVQELGNRR